MLSQSQPTRNHPWVAILTNENTSSIDILLEFGLTENQAKVFLAITSLEDPTVAEIAEHSEVRREEVYRLLPDLEKVGLVERLLGKPLRLRTPDPTSSIATLVALEREKANARISELSIKSRDLLQQLDQHGAKIEDIETITSEFSLIQEKESIRTELDEMINRSTQKLDLLFSRPDLIWLLSTQGEALRSALERGVKIRIMSEPPTGRDRLPRILERRFPENLEVSLKYLLFPTAFFLIVDMSQLLIITSGVHHLPASNCLWTNNESLIALTHKEFEERWSESVYWKTVDGISMAASRQEGADSRISHIHRLLLYQTSDVKYNVLFNFLKDQQDEGAMAIYVCSKDCVEDVKKAMVQFGFDKRTITKGEGIRILDWNSLLESDDVFNVERAIDAWDDLFFESQDKEFNGIAAATEMQFFFDNKIIEILEDYEKQIHSLQDGHMAFKCAYNEQSLLSTKRPLRLYARLLGFHTTLLTEEKGKVERLGAGR